MRRGHAMRFTIICSTMFLALGGRLLRAQDSTDIVTMTECAAHLPPSAYFRVAVYAYVHLDSGNGPGTRAGAENFLSDLAEAITRELHGTPGVLPPGDGAVGWQWVDGAIRVTAFRTGRMSWQTGGTPHPEGATQLLARALASADSAGDAIPLVANGDSTPPDSIVFWIKTIHPDIDQAGRATPMKFEGTALPVFSLPVPWFERASILPGEQPPRYPIEARDRGVAATVIEQFTVDKTGRVLPATIREVWPAGVPPLTGDRGRYWREFVASAHTALLADHFAPARIGGCVVSERVQQPFKFTIGAR